MDNNNQQMFFEHEVDNRNILAITCDLWRVYLYLHNKQYHKIGRKKNLTKTKYNDRKEKKINEQMCIIVYTSINGNFVIR